MSVRIQCPECATSYTGERLGIVLRPTDSMSVTVACMVCKRSFDTFIEPNFTTSEVGWFARTILRRQPVVSLDGHKVADAYTRE